MPRLQRPGGSALPFLRDVRGKAPLHLALHPRNRLFRLVGLADQFEQSRMARISGIKVFHVAQVTL